MDSGPTTPAPNKLSTIELVFLIAASAMVFGSAWLLGCRFPWSQWTMLALGAVLFAAGTGLYFNRRAESRIGGKPWPGWWIVSAALLGFVGYVGIQSVNIAHLPTIRGNDCVLAENPHIGWLPSSVGGDFDGRVHRIIETENAARYLLIYGASALGALGLILGIQAASTLRRLLLVLAVHGAITSLICIVHQASGSTKVLWLAGDPLAFLGAPFFFNKNQNAAYQTLLCGWTLAWGLMNAARHPRRSWGLAILGLAGLVSIRSRAGLVFAAVLGLLWLWRQRGAFRALFIARPLRLIGGAVAAAVLLGAVLWSTGGSGTLRRLGTAEATASYLVHGDKYRRLLHEVALKMFGDRPWFGWGAAGYFYAYASYEHRVPEMAANRPGFSYYLLVGHADGDWYEFLAEFGVVGTGLFALIWIPHLQLWLFRRRLAAKELVLPGVAVGLLLYHGLLDQTFRNVGVNFLLLASSVLVSKGALLLPGQPDVTAPVQETKVSRRTSRSSSDRSRKRHESPSKS